MKSDEFMRPSNVVKIVISNVTEVAMQNAFSPLDVDELQELVEETLKEVAQDDQGVGVQERKEKDKGGGNLPIPNG